MSLSNFKLSRSISYRWFRGILERDNLIRGIWAKRKRVYELTEKGERNIETILNSNDKIKILMTNLLTR